MFGGNSCGKTTLALHLAKEATDKKKTVLFVDTEQSLNIDYCEKIIKDRKYFYFKQPDSTEETLNLIKEVVREKMFDVIILDSVGGLVSKQDIKQDIGEKTIAVNARLLSKFYPAIVPDLNKNQILLLLINQERSKMNSFFFGASPKTTMGGTATRYFASIRYELKIRRLIKDQKQNVIGQTIIARVIKNKFAIPFKSANLNLYFGKGIWKSEEILRMAMEKNIIQQSGAWIKFEDKAIARNFLQLIEKFEQDNEFKKKITSLL